MFFVPDYLVLVTFVFASIALILTPGPDMTLFLGRTLRLGYGAGVFSMLGASVGCLIHTLLAVLGVSALLAASPFGFLLLKVAGAVYLFWLAVQAIFYGSTFSVKDTGTSSAGLFGIFTTGIMVNILNPKIVIFFITFLPQFVSASDPFAQPKMLFLGIFYAVFSILLTLPLILFSSRFVENLKRNPRVLRFIDYLFGFVFAGFAIKILFVEGR